MNEQGSGSKGKGPVDLSAQYATDKSAELNGVWTDIVLGDDNVLRVKLARWNNHRFQDRMRALTKPHKFQIDNDNMRAAEAEVLTDHAIAETILLDWEGEILVDGQPLSYSRANALAVLQAFPDFKDDVKARSQARDLFRKQQMKADAENLS